MPNSYPLDWPVGWPRTPASKRQPAPFRTARNGSPDSRPQPLTVYIALTRLQQQLDLLGAKYCVVSSNVELRLDGMPRSGTAQPDDPGVVVYFQLKGKPTTLPCDRYTKVADNIAAIASHIEATRRIERHGVGTLAQMFSGFQMIRGPGPKPWREVLGFKEDQRVDRDMIERKKRELARAAHPDVGGSESQMAAINAAADEAFEEIPQ